MLNKRQIIAVQIIPCLGGEVKVRCSLPLQSKEAPRTGHRVTIVGSAKNHVMTGVSYPSLSYISDHANKTGHHMTYDAPFKYQALLPSRVYTGDQGEGTGLRGYSTNC